MPDKFLHEGLLIYPKSGDYELEHPGEDSGGDYSNVF